MTQLSVIWNNTGIYYRRSYINGTKYNNILCLISMSSLGMLTLLTTCICEEYYSEHDLTYNNNNKNHCLYFVYVLKPILK